MAEITIGMMVTIKADGPDKGRVGRVIRRPWGEGRPLPEGHVFVAIFDDPTWGGASHGTNPYPKDKLQPYVRE